MKFALNIDDYSARAFGFNTKEQFTSLALGEVEADIKAVNPKPVNIPMMTARRLRWDAEWLSISALNF